uniref:Uncharacterized protein n=1 Tax=Vitis vinifera TaxID=29760 RepID=F6HR09_VITVI
MVLPCKDGLYRWSLVLGAANFVANFYSAIERAS